jgi:hypothetical protein
MTPFETATPSSSIETPRVVDETTCSTPATLAMFRISPHCRNHFNQAFLPKIRTRSIAMEVLARIEQVIPGVEFSHVHLITLTVWSQVRSLSCLPKP